MSKIAVILVAGGSGNRFGAEIPKQFLPLAGRTVLEYSLELFSGLAELGERVLVLPQDFVPEWRQRLQGQAWHCVAGGASRQDSVAAGLAALTGAAGWVLIHDAARPLASAELARATLEAARPSGAAVAAVALADTLKRGDAEGFVVETLPREGLFQIQTPQVFARELLQRALDWAARTGFQATDEATLVEKMGEKVKLVLNAEANFKITRREDLALAEAVLKSRV